MAIWGMNIDLFCQNKAIITGGYFKNWLYIGRDD